MESPITNLSNVLQLVRDSAVSYQEQLQENEAATRAALIDPVLSALGWDIANPARVQVEKTQTISGSQLRVDYALLGEGEIRIIVEAKKLGGTLQNNFLQLVQYAFAFQVQSLFLTDGLRWQHFANLAYDNQSPTQELNIATGDLEKIAAYFVQHLDAALIAPETPKLDELTSKVEQLEQKLGMIELAVGRMSAPQVPPDNRVAPFVVTPAEVGRVSSPQPLLSWQPLDALSDVKGTKPSHLRLPDGTETPVRTWAQVLVECCRYALRTHTTLQRQVPLSDKADRGVKLINIVQPPSNRNRSQIEVNGQLLYIDVNYSANSAVANALHVLNLVPSHLKETQAAITLA